MSVNAISPVNNINYFGNNKVKPVILTVKNENLKSAGMSFDASNALRAQVLYQKPKNNTQYLDNTLDKKGIIKALKNKEKMGRSFFGYKNSVANAIIKANDKNLAVDNFNILMNSKYKDGKKLHASDVADILAVATSINNKKMSEKLANKYGFNGGLLDDKSIASILDEITKIREQQAFVMIQQQQVKFNQEMQQQVVNQHIRMTTPGMGFC